LIGEDLHRQAVERLLQSDRPQLSLVDWVSFTVMDGEGIREAFALDADFEAQGYRLVPGGRSRPRTRPATRLGMSSLARPATRISPWGLGKAEAMRPDPPAGLGERCHTVMTGSSSWASVARWSLAHLHGSLRRRVL
jgi:hypothetical protein